ncbi:MAG: hypothetical protein ACI857_001838, partial [Arenicella sp.]
MIKVIILSYKMKVVSVNIGEKRTIEWAGKKIDTGIF